MKCMGTVSGHSSPMATELKVFPEQVSEQINTCMKIRILIVCNNITDLFSLSPIPLIFTLNKV